ncbi:MAG: BamA/TamA family outer membrane protein [Cyclobacteriaceae bacterium]
MASKTIYTFILGAFLLVPWHSLYCQSIPDTPPVNLDTVENTTVRINNIFILGNEKTKKSIITRELSFKVNDTINMHRLIGYQTEDRNKIYNTNLFNLVDIQILELDSENADILVKVTERWYLYPGIIFRTSAGDRNFTNWWVNENRNLKRINYGVRLSKYNLRGRDETLLLTAQFGFENVFLANYVVPYIDKNQKFGLTVDLGYAEFKNLPYKTENHFLRFVTSETVQKRSFASAVSLSYRGSFYTRHFITGGFNRASTTPNIAELNSNYFESGETLQRYFRLAYSFSRDYRDNNTYPLRGNFISASVGRNGLGIFDDYNRWYLTASYRQYFDFGKGFFLGTNLTGHISTEDVPYSRFIGLGFKNYIVRGYEFNVVEGPQVALFKSSFKKRLFKTAATIPKRWMPIEQFRRWPLALYAKTFFDAGYVNNYSNYDLNRRLSNKLLYSAGIGLDFVTIHEITIRLEQSYNAEGLFNFVVGFEQDL